MRASVSLSPLFGAVVRFAIGLQRKFQSGIMARTMPAESAEQSKPLDAKPSQLRVTSPGDSGNGRVPRPVRFCSTTRVSLRQIIKLIFIKLIFIICDKSSN